MSGGLRDQWGVDDPAQAGSDEQAQRFKAAFDAQVGKINADLQFLTAHAEAAKSEPLAGRREALYPAYQSANGRIDPANPAQAQGAIDAVLADAQALAGETSAAQAAAQQALEAWQSREPAQEQAVAQIEELEAFEDPQAATLRSAADAVRAEADAKRYEAAAQQHDALLPTLEPVYQEYLRQKEARPPCEEQIESQGARLEPLKAAERPSEPMTAKAGEAEAALEQARGQAEARDWVAGLEQMAAVATAVDELEQLVNDPEREKFLAEIGGLDAIVCAPEGTAFQSQQEDWTAITALKDQVAPAGDSGDYAGANTMIADLRERVEAFKARHGELEELKQRYEQAQAEVQPRVDAARSAQPAYAKLQPQLDELGTMQSAMDTAAQAEDYEQALSSAEELGARLDELEQARQELDELRQRYETGLAELQPRLQAVASSEAPYAKLEPQVQELAQARTAMEAAATAADYEQANTLLEELGGKVDALEEARAEIDERKQAYETALAELQPRLDALATFDAAYAKLEPMQQELAQARAAMEASAETGDYEQATTQLDDLRDKVEALEEARQAIDEARQAYEQGLAEIQPRLQAAQQLGPEHAALQTQVQALGAAQADMEAAAKDGDYERAKDLLDDLSGKLDDLESAREEIDEQKQDFEQALAELQPRLEAMQKTKGLGAARTAVDEAKAEVDAAAKAGDYAAGMTAIDALRDALDAFDEAQEDLDAKKAEYDKLLTTLQPRLAKAAQAELTDEQLKKDRDLLLADQKSMEESALVGDWNDALTTAKDLATRLDEFEKAAEAGSPSSLSGEVSIKEIKLKEVALSYAKIEAKLGAAIKFGEAAKPPAGSKVTKEEVEKSVLQKVQEVLAAGKWETGEAVKFNPKERSVALTVAPTYACEWGSNKLEVAPVEVSLIGWDKKTGSLSGPKATLVSLTYSYANESMQVTVGDVTIQFSVAVGFGVEVSPNYAKIAEWVLKNVAEKVLQAAVEGLVVDAAALATAAAAVALPAAAAIGIGLGMYQESRNMAADHAAINTALPARKKAEEVAKSYASVLCGGKSGGSDEGAANAEAQLKQLMDEHGATREEVQEAIRKALGGYEGVKSRELQRIKELMYAEACRNFDEGHKDEFGWLENRGPEWGFRGSFRKTLRIVLFGD